MIYAEEMYKLTHMFYAAGKTKTVQGSDSGSDGTVTRRTQINNIFGQMQACRCDT